MPSPVLLVESTSSNASVVTVVPVTSTAGPPVALTFAVPGAGTDTVPAFDEPERGRCARGGRQREVAERRRAGGVGHADAAAAGAGDGDAVEDARAHAGVAARCREPGAPCVVIEIVPAARKLTVPALLSRTPVGAVASTDGQVGDVERAGGGVELEAGLGAGGAGVDDVDVVDRAAAGVAGGAGDAAAGALRVDVRGRAPRWRRRDRRRRRCCR